MLLFYICWMSLLAQWVKGWCCYSWGSGHCWDLGHYCGVKVWCCYCRSSVPDPGTSAGTAYVYIYIHTHIYFYLFIYLVFNLGTQAVFGSSLSFISMTFFPDNFYFVLYLIFVYWIVFKPSFNFSYYITKIVVESSVSYNWALVVQFL